MKTLIFMTCTYKKKPFSFEYHSLSVIHIIRVRFRRKEQAPTTQLFKGHR